MTNGSHPTSGPTTRLPQSSGYGRGRLQPENDPGQSGPQPAGPSDGPSSTEGGFDSDSIYNYGLDGFTAPSPDPQGGEPQDSIDLEGLAEQLYLLLLREAYLERERRGAPR